MEIYLQDVNVNVVKMNGIIEDYIELQVPNTQRSLRLCFKLALGYFGTAERFVSANSQECIQFFATLKANKSDNTFRQRYYLIRGIYEYLVVTEVLDRNPSLAAERVFKFRRATQVRPTALVTFSAVPEIINSCDAMTKEGVRDAAIFATLFCGGLRRSELLDLKLTDVRYVEDPETETGVVPYLFVDDTKGGDFRLQTLPDWAFVYVAKHVKQRMNEGAGDSLFVSYYSDCMPGEVLSETTLYRIYREKLKEFGLRAAPHSARATFVTKLKRDGFEDRAVSKATGHKNPMSIAPYDKAGNEVLENPSRYIDYRKNSVANG